MHNNYRHTSGTGYGLSGRYRHRLPVILTILLSLVSISIITMRSENTSLATSLRWIQSPSNPITNIDGKTGKLYITSQVFDKNSAYPVGGRITVLSIDDQRAIFSTEGREAIPSPDGSHLYLVGPEKSNKFSLQPREHITAIDMQTRHELWRTSIRDLVGYIMDDGPSIMAISPDGRWLYLYSYPVGRLDQYGTATAVPFWLQIIETGTGQIAGNTDPMPGCDTARLAVSHKGDIVYVTCHGTNDVRFVNTSTGQIETLLRVPGAPRSYGPQGAIAGSILSADGQRLYIVTDDIQVIVIDTDQRVIVQTVNLKGQEHQAVVGGLVNLSDEGTKLLIGLRARAAEDGAANEIKVYDTRTWQEASRLQLTERIHRNGLAVSPDGQLIYSVVDGGRDRENTLMSIPSRPGGNSGGQSETHLLREGESIKRILIGP